MPRASRSLVSIFFFCALPLCGLALQDTYRVGKLDVLKIEVPGEEELSRDAITVSPTGTIGLPIIGEIMVEGFSVTEIADLIRKTLILQKILTQPAVMVAVREYRSQSVTILGEVRTTGKYYLRGPERLLDKIAEAGGLSPTAGDITISRTAPEGNQIITVKASELLQNSTQLLSGDVILVRPREVTQVYVSGEVVSGKPITYVEGMTLSQAILVAGGLNRFGSKSKITIKRTVDGKEEIIRVNLSDIERGRKKDIQLLPNDSIIVGRRVF